LRKFTWLAVVVSAAASNPASAARPITIQQLVGEWRITRNDVDGWDEPGAVLAYGRNDPTVVGGKLIISGTEMRFVDPKRRLRYGEHRAFSDDLDRCSSPVLRDIRGRSFNVECIGGKRFGWKANHGLFRLLSPTKIRIEWLDGVTLYLTKRR
jgi:hypothetical protein